MSNTMKAAVLKEKGGDFEICSIAIPEPQDGWVRIKVHACGICHTDINLKNLKFGGTLPKILGHEVVGEIEKMGSGLEGKSLKVGDKVGVGFYGGNTCGECPTCKIGKKNYCPKKLVTGVDFNGGFQEYMVAPYNCLVTVPNDMNSSEAAPITCAGITAFTAIHQGLIPNSLVGIQGIGGIGHYAIQYLKKLQFKVVAISSGNSKEDLCKELGADYYVSMSEPDWIQKIKSISSVQCILSSAPNESMIQDLIDALDTHGKLIVLSLMNKPVSISTDSFIFENKSIVGSLTGDPEEMSCCMLFNKNNNIKSMVQEIPLEDINIAFKNLDKARFRYVIKFN